jgi:hypothetical protein
MRRALTTLLLVATASLLVVSCTNDPFDPESVANSRPVMRFFAAPVDPDSALNATSYFSRTFHWSGTDEDGDVVEYYVSVRPDSNVPAPWDTTTRTDTTMTFTTDDQGEAQATFYLACRDDRGALSDTLVQFVPLRNFPPVLNFQSDYDPLVNLHREIVRDGDDVPVDTLYYNYGVMNARCFAFDLDGNQTMDAFYRYTLSDVEPTETFAWDDPEADPTQHWLRRNFGAIGDVFEFEILLEDVPPGERTLTVAVADEAAAESRITLEWEVRAPVGVGGPDGPRVLMVPDNSAPLTRDFYRDVLTQILGEDGFNEYDFWFGFPDTPTFLLQTLRVFDVVFWFDGGGTSDVLVRAAATGGVLQQYLQPLGDEEPGQLVMVSRNLTGNQSSIPGPFLSRIFGISPSSDPAPQLRPAQSTLSVPALGAEPYLPPLTLQSIFGRGRGMKERFDEEDPYDELYRFEGCIRCWNGQPNVEWAPLIAVRRPRRDLQPLASAVGISYELHTMQQAGVVAALTAIFEHELGVAAP